MKKRIGYKVTYNFKSSRRRLTYEIGKTYTKENIAVFEIEDSSSGYSQGGVQIFPIAKKASAPAPEPETSAPAEASTASESQTAE